MKKHKTLILTALMASTLFYGARGQRSLGGVVHLNLSCLIPADTDNFSNPSAWTNVDAAINNGNGSVQVTSNEILFSNADPTTCANELGACNNRELRIYRPLAVTLANSWRAECKFRIVKGNGITHMIMGFTSNTSDPEGTNNPGNNPWACGGVTSYNYAPTNVDGIFASIIAFGNDQVPHGTNDQMYPGSYSTSAPLAGGQQLGWRIFGHAKCGAKIMAGTETYYPASVNGIIQAEYLNPPAPPLNWSRGILLPNINVDYYLRLERLDNGNCRISVFFDAAMTQNVPGSPQCFQIDPAITGLHIIQNAASSSGSCLRSATGYVQSFKIYNNCPGIPDLSISASGNNSCPGSPIGLTATAGFTNYTWYPGGIYTGSSNTLTVYPTANTTYTVTADYPGYGADCPFQATIAITVNTKYHAVDPNFSLSGYLPATSNDFTATATPTMANSTIVGYGSGYGYLWKVYMLDPNTNAKLDSVINPSNWWNALSSNTFPGFSSNTTPSCSDNTSITSGNGSFDANYKYRIIRGAWNPCTYVEDSKTIILCPSCRSTDGSAVFTVVDEGTSTTGRSPNTIIEQTNDPVRDVKVYPNPSSGIFTIATGNSASGTISVYDLVGREVKHIVANGNATQYSVDLSGYPKGLYLLNMVLDGRRYTQKILVQ